MQLQVDFLSKVKAMLSTPTALVLCRPLTARITVSILPGSGLKVFAVGLIFPVFRLDADALVAHM